MWCSPGRGAHFMYRIEKRANAVLRLNICGRESFLSQAQSQNIPNFGRESRKKGGAQPKFFEFLNLVERVETNRNLVETFKTYQFLVKKVKTYIEHLDPGTTNWLNFIEN